MREEDGNRVDDAAPAGDAGPAAICLVSIDPSRNRSRRYTLSWQPCLWGGGALVRSWGRRGTLGRSQTSFYADEQQARGELERILRVRARHGYHLVAGGRPGPTQQPARRIKRAATTVGRSGGWWWLTAAPPNSQLSLL